MQRIVLLMCLLLSYSTSVAQLPKKDVELRENMILRKAQHYQQMKMVEQQITSNQQDYDVIYYSLDLTPDPETAHLTGIVDVAGKVTALTLNRVELNFWDGMSITNIYHSDSPGLPLDFERQFDILTINPDKVYVQGELFRLTIEYNGRPQESVYESFTFDTYNDQPMIWTMSSVFGARAWWPCKDVPSDKPDSMDIQVTVPNELIVASNGSLQQRMTTENKTTYWWHEKYPIATYLVFLAIHPYETNYDYFLYNSGADTMDIHFYSFAGNYEANFRINNKVKDMLECFSNLFGEYPFVDEKYGQADFLWGGGMEHQTCTTYGSWNETLFAHEIAHQWWGDMITCDSFHHIWLNEGFASYSEALWYEYTYPPYTASEYQMMYQLYLGPGTVYVEYPEYENIFDSGLSYVKGSWVLHMLRHVVGDDVFFDILKTYYNSPENKYGTATTEEFQAICEQVSGMNLEKFFYQWIYEEYFPRYSFSWSWVSNGSNYDIDLEIRQEQTNYTFWMPIDITVTTTDGEQTFVVWDSLSIQTFRLTTSSEPSNLELDKNDWILKLIPENIVNPTFDQGILLVNGVSFETYGDEIRSSYENRAFWGNYEITFWDCFNPPQTGYPSTLPEPLGHGKVPADILGQFSTVIWVGNDYGGDLGSWQLTSILPYLRAGGNLLLLTRRGQNYIDPELRDYLGITWAEYPSTIINNCMTIFSGLTDMVLTGYQSYNAVFETEFTHNQSRLLFQETATFGEPRGLGVWCKPTEGGQFIFISGRPYRYDSQQLRANVEFILGSLLLESNVQGAGYPITFNLDQNYPNPFNTSTTIRYDITHAADVTIRIYNIQGELVYILLDDESFSRGPHNIVWDGRNAEGTRVSSGIYLYELNINESSETRKMLLLR